MVTDSHQGLGHQLSQILNARHDLLSSSQGNLLVMLFESSCTLWNVIYSDFPILLQKHGEISDLMRLCIYCQIPLYSGCAIPVRRSLCFKGKGSNQTRKPKCYRYVFLRVGIKITKASFLKSSVVKDICCSKCKTVVSR